MRPAAFFVLSPAGPRSGCAILLEAFCKPPPPSCCPPPGVCSSLGAHRASSSVSNGNPRCQTIADLYTYPALQRPASICGGLEQGTEGTQYLGTGLHCVLSEGRYVGRYSFTELPTVLRALPAGSDGWLTARIYPLCLRSPRLLLLFFPSPALCPREALPVGTPVGVVHMGL